MKCREEDEEEEDILCETCRDGGNEDKMLICEKDCGKLENHHVCVYYCLPHLMGGEEGKLIDY